MKSIIAFCILCLSLTACTAQERARKWGGTMTEDLPAKQKLVTMTWKESHLWILTRPMREGEKAETYSFKESSSFGMVQGTIIVKEHE